MRELDGVQLIAGARGLDRPNRSVNVMEAPDIARWLRGGELLLSTGYQFRDQPEDFEDLVMALHGAGAAALGFKGRFLHEFPPHARDLAEWLGLPIISLPLELPYSDIIRIVILRTDEVENLRFSESVLRSFTQLVAEGGGAEGIVRNLMSFLNTEVCFLDTISGRCFCASEGSFSPVSSAREKKALLNRHYNERIGLGNTTYGYFIFKRCPQGNSWRIVLEHAKTAMLFSFQRDIAARQVEARYRDEFVQDLITHNIRYREELLNRGLQFGWDLSGSVRCVIFDIDDYKRHFGRPMSRAEARELEEARQRIYALCKQEMRSVFREGPYSAMSDFIVFLTTPGRAENFGARLREVFESVRKKVRSWTDFTVTVGCGDEKPDFMGCEESYEEARKAIEMMRPSCGGDALYFWEELGILTVLAPLVGSREARKFCLRRLGALRSRETYAELFDTLQVLVRCGWNLREAARELRIHYNTVRYRYERICELAGDLSGPEARLEMAVALGLCRLDPELLE
ncbi:MAG: PucR family transcriptional regulator ligand-binding domain-containing protein [Fretibacterium sp.]|nr:PucR family transcriptional regulator ligand-binding domain-containing protein [Fretibacterium sp.]